MVGAYLCVLKTKEKFSRKQKSYHGAGTRVRGKNKLGRGQRKVIKMGKGSSTNATNQ